MKNEMTYLVFGRVVVYLSSDKKINVADCVCVIINKRSFEKFYVFGSCFKMLAVILVSDVVVLLVSLE